MQKPPVTVRFWREVEPLVYAQAESLCDGNLNATVNLMLMKALGFGEYQIEEEAHKYMRHRKESK